MVDSYIRTNELLLLLNGLVNEKCSVCDVVDSRFETLCLQSFHDTTLWKTMTYLKNRLQLSLTDKNMDAIVTVSNEIKQFCRDYGKNPTKEDVGKYHLLLFMEEIVLTSEILFTKK